MSVMIIGVATDSGVPIFSRKRGKCDNVQFSTIASLHGVNMFSKCHNLTMLETHLDNGVIIWKEHCKSITLVGIAIGGLEADLKLLLSLFHDVMILFFGRKEIETLKNIDQFKRDLRQCYPIFDCLLESLDPTATNTRPTLTLDLIESVLCPQAKQLQEALDGFAECVTGRWACLSVHGRMVATSSDFSELHPREARLLMMLLVTQDGAPLRETPVFLPHMSPNVAFRAITCKLLADVYILVICGATPPLAQIDEIVLQCWENFAQTIKEAKLVYPRNFPLSINFEPCVLGILLINISSRRCVVSHLQHYDNQKSRGMSAAHRLDILRTFYVQSARQIATELCTDNDSKDDELEVSLCEAYWSSEYHKCHAQRLGDLLCCVLYASAIPTHTTRLLTSQILRSVSSNKDIYW